MLSEEELNELKIGDTVLVSPSVFATCPDLYPHREYVATVENIDNITDKIDYGISFHLPCVLSSPILILLRDCAYLNFNNWVIHKVLRKANEL